MLKIIKVWEVSRKEKNTRHYSQRSLSLSHTHTHIAADQASTKTLGRIQCIHQIIYWWPEHQGSDGIISRSRYFIANHLHMWLKHCASWSHMVTTLKSNRIVFLWLYMDFFSLSCVSNLVLYFVTCILYVNKHLEKIDAGYSSPPLDKSFDAGQAELCKMLIKKYTMATGCDAWSSLLLRVREFWAFAWSSGVLFVLSDPSL